MELALRSPAKSLTFSGLNGTPTKKLSQKATGMAGSHQDNPPFAHQEKNDPGNRHKKSFSWMRNRPLPICITHFRGWAESVSSDLFAITMQSCNIRQCGPPAKPTFPVGGELHALKQTLCWRSGPPLRIHVDLWIGLQQEEPLKPKFLFGFGYGGPSKGPRPFQKLHDHFNLTTKTGYLKWVANSPVPTQNGKPKRF